MVIPQIRVQSFYVRSLCVWVLHFLHKWPSGRDPAAPPVQCGLKPIPVETLPGVYSKSYKKSTTSQLSTQFLNNGIWLCTHVVQAERIPDTCCVHVCPFQAIMETQEREESASPCGEHDTETPRDILPFAVPDSLMWVGICVNLDLGVCARQPAGAKRHNANGRSDLRICLSS